MRIVSLGHAAILVDTGTERILVDPWLTDRLDRFWVRWPALPDGLLDELSGGLDAIVLTHHHYDHHHFPSLAGLDLHADPDFDETLSERGHIRCFYPRQSLTPRFAASGLGHQAIGWTLRKFGFTNATAVTPGDTVQVGRTVLRTFPSSVPFPEMSVLITAGSGSAMLCGDSILHPATVDAFSGRSAPRVDVAFIPAHSASPPGVLTERRGLGSVTGVIARSEESFLRYCESLNPSLVVPSSFGWRVCDGTGSFDWANHTIFPLTPAQASVLARRHGRRATPWGPGQVVEVGGDDVELTDGRHVHGPYDFDDLFRAVTLDPATTVPAFDPAHDTFGVQKDTTESLAQRVAEALTGTEFWYRAAETGQPHVLRISDEAADHSFLLDLGGERAIPVPDRGNDGGGYTHVSGATLQSLFDSELLFGSSFGLWVSNEDLLSAVFHHPRYYVRYVEQSA